MVDWPDVYDLCCDCGEPFVFDEVEPCPYCREAICTACWIGHTSRCGVRAGESED